MKITITPTGITIDGAAVAPGSHVAGQPAGGMVAAWALDRSLTDRRAVARWLSQSPEWVTLARQIAGAASRGRPRHITREDSAARASRLARARSQRWA